MQIHSKSKISLYLVTSHIATPTDVYKMKLPQRFVIKLRLQHIHRYFGGRICTNDNTDYTVIYAGKIISRENVV